jgi:hypothetical protein
LLRQARDHLPRPGEDLHWLQRARQVLVERLGIITEQAPPYCPSAKGTVEGLFRWMTQCFERRLPNSSFGIHDAHKAAEAGGMTLEELEHYAHPRDCR